MSTPETTADAIRELTDDLATCGARVVRLRAERDALQQRVDRMLSEYKGLLTVARHSMYPGDAERATASWRRVKMAMAGKTPGRLDGFWPGDLGDETGDG